MTLKRRFSWRIIQAILLRATAALLTAVVLGALDADVASGSNLTPVGTIFQLPDSLPQPTARSPLAVPYQTQQINGDPYSPSNCGPAVLAMAFAFYDIPVSVWEARQDVNGYMGIWEYSNGSSWLSLAWSARFRGLSPYGLLDEDWLYTKWTLFDLQVEADAGHPSILLVRYWDLPGHEDASWWGDHYIVYLGLDQEGNVVYHDPAFSGTRGAWNTMTQEQLLRAWNNTAVGLVRTAMSLRAGG